MQKSVLRLTAESAGNLIMFYWGGAMIGRFIGSAVLRLVSPRLVLVGVATGSLALILISANTSGTTSAYSVLAIGLMNSIMFPTIFSLAYENLGVRAADESGIINIAIFGGAVISMLTGLLADASGSLAFALVMPALCYAVIAGYALYARHPATALNL